MIKYLLVVITLGLSVSTLAGSKKSVLWQIKKSNWSKSDERSYSEFIAKLGKAKKEGHCHTTDQCLKSSKANPKYYQLNPAGLSSIFSDCADLPYVLRAYFAWMNDLPFAFPTALHPATWYTPEKELIRNEIKELQKELYSAGFFKKRKIKYQIKKLRKKLNDGRSKTPDLRYNHLGNVITSKRLIENGDNINEVLRTIVNHISTASFRTNASRSEREGLFRDTYPVEVSRDSIVPGTVLYDPNGHIAVVYEVTESGKIHLIDAHPDNSLTAITYGEKFKRTTVEIGGGFSNWRPFSYENGNVDFKDNSELDDYSLEQFQQSSVFSHDQKDLTFYEYVRHKLSIGNLKYYPEVELTELLDEICYDFKERALAVDKAIRANIHLKSHPVTLPRNIYGTEGEWETYSTPSRDARLKSSIREGRNLLSKILEGHANGDESIIYHGQNLKEDLKRIYRKRSSACLIKVVGTTNQHYQFNLDELIDGIYDLSFDPYHCVELRWGLNDSSSLSSCGDSSEKIHWYQAQAGLRMRIDRDYSLRMNYGAYELESAPISSIEREEISIKDLLY